MVEFRYTSGMVYDDEKKPIPFLEELQLLRSIVDDLQKTTPHFDFRLIFTGLKQVGEPHIQKMIEHMKVGSDSPNPSLSSLISGFDLVNEEENTPEISSFASQILTA